MALSLTIILVMILPQKLHTQLRWVKSWSTMDKLMRVYTRQYSFYSSKCFLVGVESKGYDEQSEVKAFESSQRCSPVKDYILIPEQHWYESLRTFSFLLSHVCYREIIRNRNHSPHFIEHIEGKIVVTIFSVTLISSLCKHSNHFAEQENRTI